MSTFVAPTSNVVPPLLPETRGVARRLMRHYGSNPQGRNVFYMTNGTVTENDPTDWALVAHVWWGGHEAETVTAAQATALTAAGYTVIG